jgi:hypothetical protein
VRARLRALVAIALLVGAALPFALADNCGQRIRRFGTLNNAPREVLEDCMRTGWAQAVATGVVASVAGAAIASGLSRTMEEGEDGRDEEEEEEFRSNLFQIRLRSSVAVSAFYSRMSFEIEMWDGVQWSGRRTITMSTWGSIGKTLKGEWLSSSGVWNQFSTPSTMTIQEFDGVRGAVTMGPGITFLSRKLAAGGSGNVTFQLPTGEGLLDVNNVYAPFDTDSNGLSLGAMSHISGRWRVE